MAEQKKNKFCIWLKSNWKKIVTILALLAVITVSIILINLIPSSDRKNNLQTIVLTIVAAAIGGFITLLGVWWTIKDQEKIRKEEEKRKYKPYFDIIFKSDDYIHNNDSTKSNCYFFNDKYIVDKKAKKILFCCKNSNNSIFKIIHLKIDKEILYSGVNNIILEGQEFNIITDVDEKFKHAQAQVVLVVADILGNQYNYKIQLSGAISSKKQEWFSALSIKEIGDNLNG